MYSTVVGLHDGADSQAGDGARLQKPCISLRVHSSLLQPPYANANSDLLLPDIVLRSTEKSSSDGATWSDGKLGKDPVTIRNEPSGTTHIFIESCDESRSRTQAGPDRVVVEEQIFDYSVTSLTCHRLVLQPPTLRLKEFGEKARARLDEEKQKRKEIVLLDSVPAGQIEAKNKRRLVSGTNPTRNDKLSARRRLNADLQTTTISKPTTRRRLPHQVSHHGSLQPRAFRKDMWTPNLIDIPIPIGAKRSAFVKLHGLPGGCTPDHIKKFFTGLAVERILLLLSNRIMIPILDASNVANEHYGNKYLQDQNDQNLLRVVVKFQSVSAAALAMDRSGETIPSKSLRFSQKNESGTDDLLPEAFVVGVTQLSKDLAASLSMLTVEAHHGSSLSSALAATQSKLPQNVRTILWSRAHQACPMLPVDTETRQANMLLVSAADANGVDPETVVGYQQLARHYNRLIDLHNDLLHHLKGAAATVLMSGIEYSPPDPVLRLTAQACKVLDEEMDSLSGMLYQARISRGTFIAVESRDETGEFT